MVGQGSILYLSHLGWLHCSTATDTIHEQAARCLRDHHDIFHAVLSRALSASRLATPYWRKSQVRSHVWPRLPSVGQRETTLENHFRRWHFHHQRQHDCWASELQRRSVQGELIVPRRVRAQDFLFRASILPLHWPHYICLAHADPLRMVLLLVHSAGK